MWPTRMRCGACWRNSAVAESRKGVTYVYTIEQLREFRDVPAVTKLQWLESMRRLLERALSPEKLAAMARFRRGEL